MPWRCSRHRRARQGARNVWGKVCGGREERGHSCECAFRCLRCLVAAFCLRRCIVRRARLWQASRGSSSIRGCFFPADEQVSLAALVVRACADRACDEFPALAVLFDRLAQLNVLLGRPAHIWQALLGAVFGGSACRLYFAGLVGEHVECGERCGARRRHALTVARLAAVFHTHALAFWAAKHGCRQRSTPVAVGAFCG